MALRDEDLALIGTALAVLTAKMDGLLDFLMAHGVSPEKLFAAVAQRTLHIEEPEIRQMVEGIIAKQFQRESPKRPGDHQVH